MSLGVAANSVGAKSAGRISQEAGVVAQLASVGVALVVSQNAAGQATHSIRAGTVFIGMMESLRQHLSKLQTIMRISM